WLSGDSGGQSIPSVVRRLHFTGSKLTIICSLMTTLKTCIRTITYLSDIGCLEIQGGQSINFLQKDECRRLL
ncbi:TPA: hypothetical protein ACWP5Y_003745, partial [Escherichia coli]